MTAPGTSITVTDTQAGLDLKKPDSGKPVVSSTLNTGTASMTQAYEVSGVEKSAIYKINPDQTVETVFSSKDEKHFRSRCRTETSCYFQPTARDASTA